jgi:hypothetical protein
MIIMIDKDLNSFTIQPYRRKYLKSYCDRMSKDNLKPLFDDHVASVLKEQGYTIPESPRSIYRVEKLYEALGKYAPDRCPYVDMSDYHIQQGIKLAYHCFGKKADQVKLDPLDFTVENIWKITSNHKGSAGLTAWGQTKAQAKVRAYERGRQQLKGEKRPEPCVAFKRTQFNDKTRLVWGYPYAMTAIEGIFARPLIDHFKLGGTPMSFGMETGKLGCRIRVSSYHKKYAYSTDISSFDASISPQLIRVAFKILSTWFDLSRIIPDTQTSYLDAWDLIVNYFIHTPIVMPDSNIYKGKKHGVPSGSYFTQMIDSVVNTIIVGAISSRFSMYIDEDDINVLGDDVLFWSNRDIDLEVLSRFCSEVFSAKFNADKSNKFRYDDTIEYLGRYFMDGVPYLPDDDILIRMTQGENFRKYPKDKVQKARAVRMLLLSYATVYHNAYPIYLDGIQIGRRYGLSNMSIENYVYGGKFDEFNEDWLSGLERYNRKYNSNHQGGYTPLALQFWK